MGGATINIKMMVETKETPLTIEVPAGVKAGKTVLVEALDGQMVPVLVPKGSGPGDEVAVTLTSPVIEDGQVQLLKS